MNPSDAPFRRLPSVDRLLQDERISVACVEYSRAIVLEAVRVTLDDARRLVGTGEPTPDHAMLVAAILDRAGTAARGSLRPLINATGVIIHTNLGRAPLSDGAIAAMTAVNQCYSNLEYDLVAGERGSRHSHVEQLLCHLTGAEAGLAVNNNAAAILLALSMLAHDRNVVIARGQLVEIGGGFRVPDVLRQSGARLVEVGTTNRTYAKDYESAIDDQTVLLLRVHSSNFRVIGFTHEVPLTELVAIAGRHGLFVMDDLGSGALLATEAYGLAHEPTVQESVSAGAGIVCFSGDKLLGGPQAGIIVGRKALIDQLKGHPLARAVRLDKASLAGLEATLLDYRRGDAPAKIPVWRMIAASLAELDGRAAALVARLRATGIAATVVEALSTVGGGSLPGETLPSRAVAIAADAGGAQSEPLPAQVLAGRLRAQQPAIVSRIERDSLLLDLRTVAPPQDELVAIAVAQAFGRGQS